MSLICLGMPTYGALSAGAARGFFRAGADHDVRRLIQQGSLLAANMNVLWCWALEEDPDYFAMQHADVEPAEGWLDLLVELLEAHELDVLGVALPIKDTRGLTSLAVARPDGDPWGVQCRLTLDEVHRLPPVFTSADLPGPLLINTGLWVCRWGPWAQEVHFSIRDRIVRKDGRWTVEVEPEDWAVSRRMHALGLRLGATRLVQAAHRGEVGFGNWEPWGQPFDRDHVACSLVSDRNGEIS